MNKWKNIGKRTLALLLTLLMCLGMLNLSAFASDAEASDGGCTLVEHVHDDKCYEIVRIGEPKCDTEDKEGAHEHSDECYGELKLVCELKEFDGHAHDDDCYTTETKEVEVQVNVCGMEETEGHAHSEDCYGIVTTRGELTCEVEESEDIAAVPGHTHDTDCYETRITKEAEKVLVCEDASEEHTHDDETCYTVTDAETEEVQVCGEVESEGSEAIPGHTHGDECYEDVETTGLTCGQAAVEAHEHSDDCWETETKEVEVQVTICELKETEGHEHGDDCYAPELVCEETEEQSEEQSEETEDQSEEPKEHEHTDACYETEKKLVCEIPEHTHSAECSKAVMNYLTSYNELVAKAEEVDPENVEELTKFIASAKAVDALYSAVPVKYRDCEAVIEAKGMMDELMATFEIMVAANNTTYKTGTITASSLNVRSGPSTNFDKVGELIKGDTVTIINTDGWYEIEYPGVPSAWISSSSTYIENVQDVSAGWANMKSALQSGASYKLTDDISGASTVIISSDATLDLNGHTITYTGSTGSVFHVIDGTFTLQDNSGLTQNITVGSQTFTVDKGTITGGKGTSGDPDHTFTWATNGNHTVGGGVYVQSGIFTMEGGTITGNSAGAGGGICVASGATLNVYGGAISNNNATVVTRKSDSGATQGINGGGGGIWVGGAATIDPTQGSDIVITGNSSATKNDLGGGGIYVNSKASLTLKNAIITNNTASGLGGGVAACVHGSVSILNVDNNGAAIYDNKASGTAHVDQSSKSSGNTDSNAYKGGYTTYGDFVDGYERWQNDGVFKAAAKDIFSAGASAENGGMIISEMRPTDANAQWTGYVLSADSMTVAKEASFQKITSANNGFIYGGFLVGLTSGNNNKPDFGNAHKVTISGNTSATHGGGIGCNGTLAMSYVAGTNQVLEGKVLEGISNLTFTKTLKNANIQNGQFTFVLSTQPDGSGEISRATNVGNKVTLSYADGIDQADPKVTSYTFYVQEVSDDARVTFDTTVYEVTVPVKFVKTETGKNDDATIKIHYYEIGEVTIIPGTVSGNTWAESGEATATPSFTNTWKMGSLKVTKSVVDASETTGDKEFSFTVTIGGETETFTLKAGKSWTSNEYPVGTEYTVTENSADGYTKEGEVTTATAIVEGENEVTVTNTRQLGNLIVKKTVDSSASSEVPNANDKFEFTVTIGDKTEVFILKAGDSKSFTNIPVGTMYTVTEDNAQYYTKSGEVTTATAIVVGDNEVTVNNHYYEPKLVPVSVTKNWGNTPNNYRAAIDVELYRNVDLQATVTLNRENGWSWNWGDLPEYSGENGTHYTYTVKEVGVNKENSGLPAGYIADERDEYDIIRIRNTENEVGETGVYEIVGGWSVGESGMNLTNSWRAHSEMGNTSFTVKKVDSETKQPIEGVEFTLTKDGSDFSESKKTNADGEVTFSALTDGTYTLTETGVPDAYKDVIKDGKDVNKDNSLEIKIEKDTLQMVNKLNETNSVGINTWNWKPTLDGATISTLTIENQIIKGKISVKKVLNLDGADQAVINALSNVEFHFAIYAADADQEMDDPVDTLTVKANGVAVESKELRYGEYVVVELPDVTVPAGSDLMNYDFIEFAISNDGKVNINKQQDDAYAVTATNSYTRHTGGLSVRKTVTGIGDQSKAWNFTVELKNSLSYVDLSDINVWNYTYEVYNIDAQGNRTLASDEAPLHVTGGADTVTAAITLKHGQIAEIAGIPVGTTYTVTEAEANKEGYYTTVEGAAGTIAQGTAPVAAFVNYMPSPSTYSALTVVKTWDDANNADGIRPASITVRLLQDGNPFGAAQTLSASNGWSYTWPSLNEDYDWSVEEVNVPVGYSVSYSGEGTTVITITNSHTPEEPPEEPFNEPEIPLEEFEEPGTPLGYLPPEEDEDLEEPEIPLDDTPGTGDAGLLTLWASMFTMSLGAFITTLLSGKKKKEQ